MRKRARAIVALTLGLLVVSPAQSRPAGGSSIYMVLGVGTISCGAYLDALDSDDQRKADAAAGWVAGFLSAYNAYGPDGGDITSETDMLGIAAFMRRYCADHPLKSLSDGAQELAIGLGAGQHLTAQAPNR